jgi:hypothetical protein
MPLQMHGTSGRQNALVCAGLSELLVLLSLTRPQTSKMALMPLDGQERRRQQRSGVQDDLKACMSYICIYTALPSATSEAPPAAPGGLWGSRQCFDAGAHAASLTDSREPSTATATSLVSLPRALLRTPMGVPREHAVIRWRGRVEGPSPSSPPMFLHCCPGPFREAAPPTRWEGLTAPQRAKKAAAIGRSLSLPIRRSR